LVPYEGVYDLYIEDRHLWKHAGKRKLKGELISLSNSYKTVIGHNLSLKIIDKKRNRREYIDVKNYLRRAKKLMVKEYPTIMFDFELLEKKLDLFDEVKDSNDATNIKNFVYTIIKEISLWNKKTVMKNLSILFP